MIALIGLKLGDGFEFHRNFSKGTIINRANETVKTNDHLNVAFHF